MVHPSTGSIALVELASRNFAHRATSFPQNLSIFVHGDAKQLQERQSVSPVRRYCTIYGFCNLNVLLFKTILTDSCRSEFDPKF